MPDTFGSNVYTRKGHSNLTEQIASLANDNGPSLSVEAFTKTDFLRAWSNNTPPDSVLTALFTELGIKQSDSALLPLDTFLHQAYLEYTKMREARSSHEIDELEFAGAALVGLNSSYGRAFQEFESRVQDLRDHFHDLLLDKVDSFGQFVVYEAITHPELLPTGS